MKLIKVSNGITMVYARVVDIKIRFDGIPGEILLIERLSNSDKHFKNGSIIEFNKIYVQEISEEEFNKVKKELTFQ